jgi:hypothetical protein
MDMDNGHCCWVLQLTDSGGHHIHQSRTDKECVEPYFHHSYVFVQWCLGMLTAAQHAGVVETHISLLVCGTPNDADSS